MISDKEHNRLLKQFHKLSDRHMVLRQEKVPVKLRFLY